MVSMNSITIGISPATGAFGRSEDQVEAAGLNCVADVWSRVSQVLREYAGCH